MIWYHHENERDSREKSKKLKKSLDFFRGVRGNKTNGEAE
jgi:hypothetical protein